MNDKLRFKYYIALVFGILVLINILANRFYFRLDFTEDQRYTLSETTKDILKEVTEPITVTAYFSEGLQPQFDQYRKDFKDLLTDYASCTNHQLVFEFINPNDDAQEEQKAVEAGIRTVMIEAREKDQSTTKKAYMGALVQMGNEVETIPFIQPGAQMEYDLTTAIKKMAMPDKDAIGFITGHGEPSLNELTQVAQGLEVLYVPEEIILSDSINLSKYKTLAWINPQDTIPEEEFSYIDNFLRQGGKLLVSFNNVDAELNRGIGLPKETGMAEWLKKQGLTVNSDFVIDASCGSINVQQRQGLFTVNRPISFPYLPVISNFAEHPITQGLGTMIMQFASSLSFTGDSTCSYSPLIFTSNKSGKQAAPVYFSIEKKWQESDFTSPKLPLAALLEQDRHQIVVITDGDLAVNGAGEEAHQVQGDNANFIVNAIDFMSDDTGLIQLRSKQVKMRPLDQLEDKKKNILKILNFILPILIILGIGIYRSQKRKINRLKLKGENYV